MSISLGTGALEIEQLDETDVTRQHQNADESDENITNSERSKISDISDKSSARSLSADELSPLSKSNRLKKYLILAILSSLAFASAYESDQLHILTSYSDSERPIAPIFVSAGEDRIVKASASGRYYTMVLSGVSAVYHFLIVAVHLFDGIFAMPRMRKIFQNGSEIECVLIVISAIWWVVGAWITTSIHGVAGDGKGQFNIYLCSWLCVFTNVEMIETWLMAAGYASVYQAVSSWPNRAPGWIMIFIATLACMLSILDTWLRFERALDGNNMWDFTKTDGICEIIYNNSNATITSNVLYQRLNCINDAQWVFLILACAVSFTAAFGFSLIELFRREDHNIRNKSSFVLSLEGIVLALLVFIWVSVCVIATTDGVCSEVGNSYFLTWGSTAVVIQTFINWLRDWRRGVHDVIVQQEREYRESQANVEPMNSSLCDDDSDRDHDV
jgi:hypothetical protein|eukprot:scaffold2209_cov231-Chaetoceros_neogracile.AAC.3